MPKGEKRCAHKPWEKSPVIGNNGLNLEPGDNNKFIGVTMQFMNMKPIDKTDPVQVEERLNEYFRIHFENDMKPTVAAMAMSLDISRQTLLAIVNDYPTGGAGYKSALPSEVAELIKKAYRSLENLWENYMNNGKINPMAGVFLGINNYKYKDTKQVEVVPQVDTQSATDYSAADIAKRYKIEDGVIDTEKAE